MTKKSISIVLVLSMLWGTLPILAQPPFAFSDPERREYLQQILEESIEDEDVASLWANHLLDEEGMEKMIAWSEEHFGERFKSLVNESLKSLVKEELQTELDEDYTYINFDETYTNRPVLIAGASGAVVGVGAVVAKAGGAALLSLTGVGLPLAMGLLAGIVAFGTNSAGAKNTGHCQVLF